jgi:hypothetical protein
METRQPIEPGVKNQLLTELPVRRRETDIFGDQELLYTIFIEALKELQNEPLFL